MYENLTKYLDEFTGAEFSTWIADDKNDGTLEHPIQFPFVDYSIVVDQFIQDVYSFVDNHEEMGLHNYPRRQWHQMELGTNGQSRSRSFRCSMYYCLNFWCYTCR